MSDDTDMGPLVNAEGLNKIDSIVKDTVKEGAEVLTGGERIINLRLFNINTCDNNLF